MKAITTESVIIQLTKFGFNNESAKKIVLECDKAEESHFDYLIRVYGNVSNKKAAQILSCLSW